MFRFEVKSATSFIGLPTISAKHLHVSQCEPIYFNFGYRVAYDVADPVIIRFDTRLVLIDVTSDIVAKKYTLAVPDNGMLTNFVLEDIYNLSLPPREQGCSIIKRAVAQGFWVGAKACFETSSVVIKFVSAAMAVAHFAHVVHGIWMR